MSAPTDRERLILRLRAFANDLSAYQDTYEDERELMHAAADALSTPVLTEDDYRGIRHVLIGTPAEGEQPPEQTVEGQLILGRMALKGLPVGEAYLDVARDLYRAFEAIKRTAVLR